MSNENITVWSSTPFVLEASGAGTIANNAIVAASIPYSVETDGAGFPDADFVLSVTFNTAPVENSVISLHARPLDIDGTADADAPETTRPTMILGVFQLDNRTGLQTLALANIGFVRDVPRKAEYWLYNNGTGQAVQAGWSLKLTPRTNKAA